MKFDKQNQPCTIGDLAEQLNVTRPVLWAWLDKGHIKQMYKLGYRPNQTKLKPPVVAFLRQTLIVIDEKTREVVQSQTIGDIAKLVKMTNEELWDWITLDDLLIMADLGYFPNQVMLPPRVIHYLKDKFLSEHLV